MKSRMKTKVDILLKVMERVYTPRAHTHTPSKSMGISQLITSKHFSFLIRKLYNGLK